MSLITKIRYHDSNGIPRTKNTRKFQATTSYETIRTWIAKWWGLDKTKVKIEIKDQPHEFVTFDQDYINDYHPYGVDRQTQNSGAHSNTVTPPFIELRLRGKHNQTQNLTHNGLQQASNAILSTDVQQSQRPTTSHKEILTWIAKWWGIDKIDIEIKDEYNDFVDFHPKYIKEFNPYGAHRQTQSSGAQSITVTPQFIELHLNGQHNQIQNLTHNGLQQVSNAILSTDVQQSQRPADSVVEQPKDGMSVTTKICYTDSNKTSRIRSTKAFQATTSYGEIFTWIAEWRLHCKFHIEIKDEYDEFVDFDQDYINEFHPYGVDRQTQKSGAQSTRVTPPFIELCLKEPDKQTQNLTHNGLQQASNAILSTDVQQSQRPADSVVEQPQGDREDASSSYDSSRLYSFDGPVKLDEETIKLQVDVNYFLRNQYNSEPCMICIQGNKDELKGNARKKKVEPKVKIEKGNLKKKYNLEKDISKQEIQNWALLIFEAIHKGHPRKRLGRVKKTSEISGHDEKRCSDGTRDLFYNAWRGFATSGDNKTDQTDLSINDVTQKESQKRTKRPKPYVRIPLTMKILNNGVYLNLRTKVIRETKTHNQPLEKFCQLADRYSPGTEYETDRLAFLLEKNGKPLWNSLALSKSMAFGYEKMIKRKKVSTIDGKFNELIAELKMKRKKNFNQPVIRETKTHNQPLEKFCQLADRYSPGAEYETDRLAFLLEKNGKPLWNSLALSKSMAFGNKKMIKRKKVSTIDGKFNELIAELKMIRKKNFNQPELKRLQKPRQSTKHRKQTMATSLVTSHETRTLNGHCLQRVEDLTSFDNQQSQETNIPMGMQHHIVASSDRMTINRSTSKELVTPVVQLIAPANFQVSNTENLLDKTHQELDGFLEQPKLTQNVDNSIMEIDLDSQNGNVNGTHVNSSLYSNCSDDDLHRLIDSTLEKLPEDPNFWQDLSQFDPNTNGFSEAIENLRQLRCQLSLRYA
ncbi:unnamed protein product [Rotaria socialis]